MRGIDQIEAKALKRASRQLIKSVGGIEAAADLVGKKHAQVGRWHNRDDLGSWINLADLRMLEDHAEAAFVTAEMARLAGGCFIPLPDRSGDGTALAGRLIEIMDRVGKVAGQTQQAIADGVCEPREAAPVRQVVAEAIAALVAYDAQLAEIEAGADRAVVGERGPELVSLRPEGRA